MGKEAIGFKTPAKGSQEAMAELLSMLDAQGESWAELQESMTKRAVVTKKAIQQLAASKDADREIAAIALGAAQYFNLCTLIARLGLEMTETHKRLTKVEKAVKDLKLAARCRE